MKADIVIAGAGLVGTLAALVLARRFPSWQVVLLDPETDTPKQDPRTIALALRSQQVLADLGVWQQLATATSIRHIHISDSTGAGSTMLHAEQEQVTSLGYVVQATLLQEALTQACEQEQGIHWLKGSQINAIAAADQQQNLSLNTGQQLAAKLLVVSDGSCSPTREKLGVPMQVSSYQQTALAGFLYTDKAHQETAYEHFTPDGPFALLPYGAKCFALIWCAQAAQVKNLLAMPEMAFRHQAQALFGSRAGYFTGSERVGAFPLSLAFAQHFVGHRYLVLGNACHTLHPVAGQGYNLGVRDVLALEQVLAQTSDPGTLSVLQQYEQLRQCDYQQITQFTDTLVKLFSNQNPLLSAARRNGIAALRCVPFLAKPLTQKAMGFGAQETLWR